RRHTRFSRDWSSDVCSSDLVAGHDVARHPRRVRRSIGLVGQYAAVDELLTGRQNLELFGRLYHLDARAARDRAAELLDAFGLDHPGPVGEYSGGMRRRLDLAASMILDPAVLFLDEPTTGLDPRSRGEVWQAVRGLVAGGTTVLLTTQYLEEADQLPGRVVVIDAGQVVAGGTPDDLKSRLGGDRLDVVIRDPERLGEAAGRGAAAEGGPAAGDPDPAGVSVRVTDRVAAVAAVRPALAGAGVEADDGAARRPSLDEVFLSLAGTRREEG